MRYNLSSSDYIQFLLCCIYFVCGYFYLSTTIEREKSKSWIISMLTSPLLSMFGTYYAFEATYYSLWTEEYIYSENMLSRFVIIFFVSSNIMDLVVGCIYYPKYLDVLTSFVHHTFYIGFMVVILFSNYSTGFVICFIMEIPTAFLAIGTVYPSTRSDISFGFTFLLTRIIFNIYQAYKLRCLHNDGMIWKVCVLVLCFHLYWFSTWWKKYGIQSTSSSHSTVSRDVDGKSQFLQSHRNGIVNNDRKGQ